MLRLTRGVGISLTLAFLLSANALAQQPATQSLRGVWRVAEIVEGPGGPNPAPFPGFYLFTDKHYSLWVVLAARPKYPPGKGTDAEKIATFDGFAGNSGTYEINGNTVAMHPMIGKNEYIVGMTSRAEFRIEGDTLFWTSVVPGGAKTVTKLVRLE